MTSLQWALLFGGALCLAAVVISVACLRAFAAENAREDAHYARLRGQGMGQLRPDEDDR